MSDALLSALKRRFAAQAELLPAIFPALVSDDPTPFLVRYRPDALGGAPEAVFRKLRQAVREERETERRRQTVRRALESAGLATDDVLKLLAETTDPFVIDELSRTARATKPGEAAQADDPMRPAARDLLAGAGTTSLEEVLAPFCGADGAPPTAADQRARLVRLVADLMGADIAVRRAVRAAVRRGGVIATAIESRRDVKPAYQPFASWTRPVSKIPPRVLLLLRRGQKAGVLRATVSVGDDERKTLLAGALAPREGHPFADLVREAAADALDRVLLPAAMNDVLKERKRAAERALLPILTQDLRDKLLARPAGRVNVAAVIPGSTGTCRVAVVLADGRPGPTVAVHPLPPRHEKEEAAKAFVDIVRENGVKLVAVAASGRSRPLREWVTETLAANRDLGALPVPIHEAAAVAWAESEAGKAAEPELPATVRAAVSVGRCLQDPLAEALRYDLCEIPLGPNQGDVDQGELRRRLDETAESCAALVGVDVNTASAAALARVPGLGESNAAKIVAWREKNGPFATRADVRQVEGLPELAWQHAAGFLRIRGGVEPLDATGVHPTGAVAVPLIAAKLGVEVASLVGRADLVGSVDPKEFAGPVLTESDVRSVLAELAAGSADPRGAFLPPAFNPGVARTKDLAAGMEIDGVVTSVSKFGAFVDVGAGQDGLVHVSELAHRYVKEPSEVVSVGQSVRVKVVNVDNGKRRISLSMKALIPAPERPADDGPVGERSRFGGRREGAPGAHGGPDGPRRPQRPRPEGAASGGRGGAARGPGGFVPERPGTAPRRAQKRGFGDRKGKPAGDADAEVDLSRDSGTGSFGSLTSGRGGSFRGGGRGGDRGGDRGGRPEAPPPRQRGPGGMDPFQLQLAALRLKLEGGDGATDPGSGGDRPTS